MLNKTSGSEGNPLLDDRQSHSYSNEFVLAQKPLRVARPEQWGATPEARKGWALAHYDTIELEMLSIPASPPNPTELPSEKSQKYPEDTSNQLFAFFYKTPGFLIAITLNLFLSMSFGAAFFPQYWQDSFPHYIPRTALGVQMFLFSTFICQLTMTSLSDFPTAMGMMMVENIPFMHRIAELVTSKQGMAEGAFATVLAAFALSSIVVGLVFFLLGKFKVPFAEAHLHGWFFAATEHVDPLLMWKLIDVTLIDWNLLVTAIFMVLGPSVVYFMPRVMPGCLLMHIGMDLTMEVMTLFGMSEGLALGVLCAALTFTLQAGRHVPPIRRIIWRTPKAEAVLKKCTMTIRVVQLQGHLFFGNATLLADEIEKLTPRLQRRFPSFILYAEKLMWDYVTREVLRMVFPAIPTASVPLHLQQIHSLLEIEGESTSSLKQMMSFFVEESVSAGSVLWRQGDPSDRAVLLVMGQLRSALEDEVGTTEAVLPGHLVGEFGLLNGQSRL
eukprot:gene18492-18769_t